MGSQTAVTVIIYSTWEGNQVAVKVNSSLLAQYLAMKQSGVARMSKLCGHSIGTLSACVTRICYEAWDIHPFLNYTLWDRFWGRFRPQIPFFRPTCMLTSCPHETCNRTFDCKLLVTSSDLSPREDWKQDYLGPSKLYPGLARIGPGVFMPLQLMKHEVSHNKETISYV